ncbi:hypothetical protein QBC36DRAFT_327197 [Triangularia setosa]|uniref:Uncharacterized protein n=1 Tax=Triangularia setosa TaxID=2587417 RepID=A0AAN6W984_9PEZI|nr:hypothetical protein QBC36DRAFT_327197 [Podospora setosa]
MAATMAAATMGDAARLVSELHDKLAELDGKVAAYRRDMLAEFHKHMEDCLKAYPDDISSQVSRVIAESMFRYPALSPTRYDMAESPATTDHKTPAWKGRKSPPPVLPHTSGVPKEGPRSPHERDKEFQGVFTPTYLPLLESNERSSHRSPPTSPVSIPVVQQQQPQQEPQQLPPPAPLSVDNVKKVEEIKKPEPPVEGRPDPIRRLTDRSTSSVESSSSESKVRRSALRRRSSSIKGAASPRRVRFDFSGEEVFPSSSPQQAASLVAMAVKEDEAEKPKAELLPVVEPSATTAAVAEEDESFEQEEYTGTSLLDVEGEEDLLPRPKKVSSTQALQALTRSPLEEGSFWTVVNANNNEEPGKMNGQKEKETINKPDPAPVKVDSQATLRPIDGPGEEFPVSGLLGSPIEELEQYNHDDDESEEEFLSMRPKNTKKPPSPGAQTPFKSPPASRFSSSNQTSMAFVSSKTNGIKDVLEEDPLFDFEDGENGAQKAEKYLPEDDDDGVEAHVPHRPVRTTPTPLQTVPEDENKKHVRTTSLPPVSPSAVLFGHSVGSFKGNSFSLNPIKNTKLYDEIAGLKDVHFFVGSVDGRSGAEAADMGSYRAMSKGVSVVPRSFTERLAIEEAMERRERGDDEE